MTTRLKFHGISCYEVTSPLGRVLLDPALGRDVNPNAPVSADQVERPDVILVSHSAWDHSSGAAEIATRTGAPVVCGFDTAQVLEAQGVPRALIRTTTWGIRVKVGNFLIRPVECHHWAHAVLPDGRLVTGVPLSFVVETEPGVRVYHFGDSAVFGDMRLIGQLHRPTVGLLGVTQPWSLVAPGPGEVTTGEMSPDEAALAAELLGVEYAVATHYQDPEHQDVKRFLEEVPKADSTGKRKALALRLGETLVIEGDDWKVEEGRQ